jgi:hypothetical protein
MVSAFLIPARRARTTDGTQPSPWITGALAFVLGMGVMSTPPNWGWAAAGVMLALDAVFLVLVAWASRRTGWSALHALSLAAGGALVYGIHAFVQKPLMGGLLWMRISTTVFLAAAVWLIWLGARRVIRYQTPV